MAHRLIPPLHFDSIPFEDRILPLQLRFPILGSSRVSLLGISVNSGNRGISDMSFTSLESPLCLLCGKAIGTQLLVCVSKRGPIIKTFDFYCLCPFKKLSYFAFKKVLICMSFLIQKLFCKNFLCAKF